jgi:cytochrome b561
MLVLFVLHVGAALKHHFIDRDGTTARMMPFGRS